MAPFFDTLVFLLLSSSVSWALGHDHDADHPTVTETKRAALTTTAPNYIGLGTFDVESARGCKRG